MACKNCNEVVIESCEETLCDGTVSLPCDFIVPAACVKNVTALPNLGACNDVQNDYACTDLQTILLAIDGQLENCGSDTFVESGALDGTDLVLTLNDTTEVTVDLESLIAGTGYWDRNSGSGFLFPNTLTDDVGIGTNTPAHKLHVLGDFLASETPTAGSTFNVTNGVLDTNATLYNGNQASALHHKNSTLSDSIVLVVEDLAILTATTSSGSFNATVQADISGVNPQLLLLAVNSTNSTQVQLVDTSLNVNVSDGVDTTSFSLTKDNLVIDSLNGWSGTFTNGDGDTVTVTKGIITNVAP